MNINPYDILNLKPYQLNKKNVKKAYLDAIRLYPPEKNPDRFKKIRKAYDTLISANSPYDKLSLAPQTVVEMTYTEEDLKNYLEKILNISDKKTLLKKQLILETIEKESL